MEASSKQCLACGFSKQIGAYCAACGCNVETQRPFKPRCRFGHGHHWVFLGDGEEEVTQCSVCGTVSSRRAKVSRVDRPFAGQAAAEQFASAMELWREARITGPHGNVWRVEYDEQDIERSGFELAEAINALHEGRGVDVVTNRGRWPLLGIEGWNLQCHEDGRGFVLGHSPAHVEVQT